MTARELIESRGRKPVLGWCDNRVRPVNLRHTDIRETWVYVRQLELLKGGKRA
jgi:hypothetical protein